jgi:hypothetical protein
MGGIDYNAVRFFNHLIRVSSTLLELILAYTTRGGKEVGTGVRVLWGPSYAAWWHAHVRVYTLSRGMTSTSAHPCYAVSCLQLLFRHPMHLHLKYMHTLPSTTSNNHAQGPAMQCCARLSHTLQRASNLL